MKKILIVLLILMLVATLVGCGVTTREEFEATVVDIEVSAGGFGTSTLYLVEFDNGKKLAFSSGGFVVGNRYYVLCSFNRNYESNWRIEELRLLEKGNVNS